MEAILPHLADVGAALANRCLRDMRGMLEYMATAAAWTGPRPPRFLIWPEDIPSRAEPLPRPLPPVVVDQLDSLLDQAVQATVTGQDPPILPPVLWDALLILRRTGMRFEDLAHLKAPTAQDRQGCLAQDSTCDWWICIDHRNTKMGRAHRIPTNQRDGTVDAVRRQRQRVENVPDHFGENYLFRTDKGILTYGAFQKALEKLAPSLPYEGQPYRITPHQFRHTIATDMIEHGVDIYTVKEFLGHASLAMTQRYVKKVYRQSLKAKFAAYRVQQQRTASVDLIQVEVTAPTGDADSGWDEGKVGKLYRSPLPGGMGWCTHLPMHDACPTAPYCPPCPKLHAAKRHLSFWDNQVLQLRRTCAALQGNPAYARALAKHEQELRQAERIAATIQGQGYWDGRIHNTEPPQV